MKEQIENNEIDLIEVIINIWNNKLKIAVITTIFIALSIALYFLNKPTLKAKTEILPITIFENNLYSAYSLITGTQDAEDDKKKLKTSGINPINRDYLLILFIEELQTKKLIQEAIKKYQLMDRKKFNTEKGYLEKKKKKALKLNLLRPVNLNTNKRGETRLNWIIEFEVNEEDKWEEALAFIEIEINNNIKKYLKLNFNTALDNLKLLDQFKLEDLNLKINNVKKDYDNNTLDVENFNTPTGVISNLQTAKPYYMRGYVMIEKEIELIETRTNKDAFTKDLLTLEKQKRSLLENKLLERTEILFNNTPIIVNNNFKAARIIYQNTKYHASYSLKKTILFSGIFGIIFGMFYVLFSSAIRQRK